MASAASSSPPMSSWPPTLTTFWATPRCVGASISTLSLSVGQVCSLGMHACHHRPAVRCCDCAWQAGRPVRCRGCVAGRAGTHACVPCWANETALRVQIAACAALTGEPAVDAEKRSHDGQATRLAMCICLACTSLAHHCHFRSSSAANAAAGVPREGHCLLLRRPARLGLHPHLLRQDLRQQVWR